ncbi:MAG: DUF4236 domain-containing protein [Fimbriimonadia bacterium]|jgi:hypothetical protein
MGFRFQRRIRLGKGLWANLSKGGVGFSVGRRGLRFSINPRGKKQVSVGAPGTGMSYRTGCILPTALLLLALASFLVR